MYPDDTECILLVLVLAIQLRFSIGTDDCIREAFMVGNFFSGYYSYDIGVLILSEFRDCSYSSRLSACFVLVGIFMWEISVMVM
jgi:hypothetical protein